MVICLTVDQGFPDRLADLTAGYCMEVLSTHYNPSIDGRNESLNCNLPITSPF